MEDGNNGGGKLVVEEDLLTFVYAESHHKLLHRARVNVRANTKLKRPPNIAGSDFSKLVTSLRSFILRSRIHNSSTTSC